MERNGFNPNFYESSNSESDDSKEKAKSKKAKRVEAAPTLPEAKKEEIASHGKSVWEKLVKPEEKSEKDSEEPLAPRKGQESPQELEQSPASESRRSAETALPDAEVSGEDDPTLEVFSPEEDVEVTAQLIDQQIETLQAEAVEGEEPAETVSREAAIAMLEDMKTQGEPLPADEEPGLEDGNAEGLPPLDFPLGAEAQNSSDETQPEPAPFDEDGAVPLRPTSRPTAGASNTAGGATPPPPPPPPRGGAGPAPAQRPPEGGGSFAAPAMAPRPRSEYQPDYRHNPNATYLLVGGIVGYLIGRRRGRIKTEKRMSVVQRKLEKQVEAKQQALARKVEEVKTATREKYEAQAALLRKQTEPVSRPETMPMQASSVEAKPKPVELSPTRTHRPEATPSLKRAEVKAEGLPSARQSAERVPTTIELKDDDIVRLSEKIEVGATSLKQVYEAKLITKSGLRRLVNEHLQGRDIRRGLAREFLAKELSFERDPRFRDAIDDGVRGGGTAVTSVAVPANELPADTSSSSTSQFVAPPPPATRKSIPVTQPRSAVSTGLLTVLTILAIGLAAWAVLLSLGR